MDAYQAARSQILQSAIADLDRCDDAIAERIRALAELLRERVRIAISTKIDEDRVLRFGKHQGAWQFVVQTEREERPLLGCSRAERAEIAGGGFIMRLFDTAADQVASLLPMRREVINHLDALLEKERR